MFCLANLLISFNVFAQSYSATCASFLRSPLATLIKDKVLGVIKADEELLSSKVAVKVKALKAEVVTKTIDALSEGLTFNITKDSGGLYKPTLTGEGKGFSCVVTAKISITITGKKKSNNEKVKTTTESTVTIPWNLAALKKKP